MTKPVYHSELHDALATVMSRPPEAGMGERPGLVTRHSLKKQRTVGRVLLAEDNPVNQKAAVRMLERLDYRVDVTDDGRQVLDALALTRYAAVLMDVQMPGMGGYEATAELRRRERVTGDGARRTPVIAMTANAVRRTTHTVKDGSGNMGARRLGELCGTLEKAAGELERASGLLGRVEAGFARVRRALEGETGESRA